MSEIPFVNALGDSIEQAITARAPVPRRRWSRIRMPRGRKRLVAVVAALSLGGAAFAATQQNSTTLVTGGIACIAGTGWNAPSDTYNVEANGRSPQEACAQAWRSLGAPDSALAAPGVRLVACTAPHGFVDVFKATGSSRQCQKLGLSPLAPRAYLAAAKRVQELVKRLWAFRTASRCIPPRILVRRVDRVLHQLEWTSWHARIQNRPATDQGDGGPCGMFEATGRYISDPTASLDGQHRTIWVIASAPR